MKNRYLLILFVLLSCKQEVKEKKETVEDALIEEVVKEVHKPEEEIIIAKAVDAVGEAVESLNFKEVIAAIPSRPLPLTETTNFDDFIEAKYYMELEEIALQLEKLYPDFNTKNSGYKAIRNYRLEFSETFYTVVVTILKNEHEMESVLINYTQDGEIIDSKVVSYDEIAEGQSQINSKIDKNSVIIDNIFWGNKKQVTTKVFKILDNGKIELDNSGTTEGLRLIDTIITQLNLDVSKIKTDLIVSKVQPNNSNETIVVIPEIAEEYDEYHFDMNSHIVLFDNTTQKITHRYFESSKANGWMSDAVALNEIKIDTAPYRITNSLRAFGIRVHYYGSSYANPYSNETLSLFIKSDNTLKKVLHNYDVMHYGGEWDTNCFGEFIGSKATLAISFEKTNGYFDILVETTITETKNFESEQGDCESKDLITTEKEILKFNGQEYILRTSSD